MTPDVKITNTEILSDNWYILRKVTFEYTKEDGSIQTQSREAYDREMVQQFSFIIKIQELLF